MLNIVMQNVIMVSAGVPIVVAPSTRPEMAMRIKEARGGFRNFANSIWEKARPKSEKNLRRGD